MLQLIVEVVKTYLQREFLMLCVCVLQEWALEKKRLTDANAQALEKASTAQLVTLYRYSRFALSCSVMIIEWGKM